MKNWKVLVIDDDTYFCILLKKYLEKNQLIVDEAYSAEDAIRQIKQNHYDVILSDLKLPQKDGFSILSEAKSYSPDTPVVMMSGIADISTAVKSIKMNAFDYLTKPFQQEKILATIHEAIASSRKQHRQGNQPSKYLQGYSKEAKKLEEYIQLVAPTDITVLITGPSGTGKEYIAHRIHMKSKRRNGPFVAVDCGAIPSDLTASEFFGHKKGSFTGAIFDKTGQLEAAQNGTIFLDEIGNLSYQAQVQLLRAIQEKSIKPVGSTEETPLNIRIIAATNEDLLVAMQSGKFREDLYHRLNEFQLFVPSLKERQKDLMLFVDFFIDQANNELGKAIKGLEQPVIKHFQDYCWPGNLRELKNTIKRAALISKNERITISDIPSHIIRNNYKSQKLSNDQSEYDQITNALKDSDNNKTKAARMLNIDRKTLYNKLKKYRINYL